MPQREAHLPGVHVVCVSAVDAGVFVGEGDRQVRRVGQNEALSWVDPKVVDVAPGDANAFCHVGSIQ